MRLTRNLLYLLLAVTLATGCNNSTESEDSLPSNVVNNPKSSTGKESKKSVPKIAFEKSVHDFGRVIEGEKITYAFRFSNPGDNDLLISDVKASCGCTVPEFTKEPLKPGEKGHIKITFDSSNRKGFQNKSITVISNTIPSTTILKIKAQVVVPEQF
jgi:hypothetical protein